MNNMSVRGKSITMYSGDGGTTSQSVRRVIVTPISALPTGVPTQPVVSHVPVYDIERVLLKAVCSKGEKPKKDPRTFTLRNINTAEVFSGDKLQRVIKTQLSDDVEEEFEVGVVEGSNIVSIHSREDMMDVWNDIKKGTKKILWCDGLRSTRHKRKQPSQPSHTDEDDSDEDFENPKAKRAKKMEERENKVHDTLKELKEKHGHSFSPMQLRIWSEMLVGEIHSSLDEPPSTSMFARAGNVSTTTKKDQCATSQALTEAATVIATALPANQGTTSCGRGSSPAKLIEGCSKCYKQLSELNNLKVGGIISDEEYLTEKQAIMAILNTLKATR